MGSMRLTKPLGLERLREQSAQQHLWERHQVLKPQDQPALEVILESVVAVLQAAVVLQAFASQQPTLELQQTKR
jgi:hypothetical protein